MKNNKKLVVLAGAAALGLVAATGVTSGFAWFAVNSTVSATSLNVSAKSNASYLLIGTADNATNKTGSDTTIAGVDPANTTVYPVAYTGAGTVHWDGPDGIASNSDDVNVAANSWYTATVNNPDFATPDEEGASTAHVKYTNLAEVTNYNASYFVTYNFWLTLGTGSEAVTRDITMTADFAGDHASVKAAVVFDGATTPAILATGSASTTFEDVALAANTSHTVVIHMYIDGTQTAVKSATDISTLIGEVSFTFAI